MSHVKRIINYFFNHQFSDEMVDKIHRRLLVPGDDVEKEEELQAIWNEIGYPQADLQTKVAFTRLEEKLGQTSSRFRMPEWLRIAAVWFIPLLALSASWYFYHSAKSIEGVTFVEQYVPLGEREQITLPDGSLVWLNSGSLLLYPSAFKEDKREVYLIGEACFSVQKSRDYPFVVNTNLMQAEVLGTEFNLSAYPGDEKVIATLIEGSIRIQPNDLALPAHILKPNEQLTYFPRKGEVDIRKVVATDYSTWCDGGLLFSNDPFEDILKAIERNYNMKVHLRTSAYHSNRLTIHFNKNESVENVLRLIKEMIPGMEYQIKEKDVYIE